MPRLGFIYDLAKSHQLYGNVSRNFEAPIFGVDTGPGMVATQAQTGITYELGSRGDFSFETEANCTNFSSKYSYCRFALILDDFLSSPKI